MGKMGRLGAAAAGLAFAVSAPAHGQAWIGQVVGNMMAQQQAAAAKAACMSGAPMAAEEVAEARAPANALMQAYRTATSAGSAPRSSFYALDKKARFAAGGTSVDRTALDEPAEPLAQAGYVLDAEPFGFVRSGLDATALGQWALRDAQGKVAGVYTAYFVRKLGEWKLRTLAFETPAEYAGPVEQFCHAPGDVLPYRLETGERMTAHHAKRLAKAEAKAEKARAKASKLEGAGGRGDAAWQARAEAEKWAAEVAERRAAFETANGELTAARAYEATADDRKAQARVALGLD